VARRYFEIIITGRQLAALVFGVAAAIAVGFGIGVGVGALQRAAPPVRVASVPLAPPESVPATAPTAVSAVAAPTPAPTLTPPPAPTQTPRPAPTAVAAAKAVRWVQVAALSAKGQAEGARNRVVALGFTPRQVIVEPAGGKFRIRVGPFPDGESAARVAARLRAEGFRGAFVVRPGE
jgi:cell division protein FtsN